MIFYHAWGTAFSVQWLIKLIYPHGAYIPQGERKKHTQINDQKVPCKMLGSDCCYQDSKAGENGERVWGDILDCVFCKNHFEVVTLSRSLNEVTCVLNPENKFYIYFWKGVGENKLVKTVRMLF